jgi:hypothetical protein
VPLAILRQFLGEGLRYVGRIRLAHDLGPAPAPGNGTEGQEEPDKDGDGNWLVKAVRCTADGDLYVGRCGAAALLGRAAARLRAAFCLPACPASRG